MENIFKVIEKSTEKDNKRLEKSSKEHVPNPKESVGFMVIDQINMNYPIGGLIGLVANRISDKEQNQHLLVLKKMVKYLSFLVVQFQVIHYMKVLEDSCRNIQTPLLKVADMMEQSV